MEGPLVSVVIPSYMHGHLIDRALRSVVKQSYKNWEAIVVDNYSTDQTDQVITQIGDYRIRLLKINNEGVIAASRNLGIREAKGEWIAFLDSDDWWTEDKIQICVSHINDKISLIYHDLVIWRDKKIIWGSNRIKSRKLKFPPLKDLLINGNTISNSSVMVRKDVLIEIEGLNESKEFVTCEDYHAWLRIAELEKNFKYIPKSLGFYYLNGQGMSLRDMSIPATAVASCFWHMLDSNERQVAQANLHYTRGRYHFVNKNYKKSRKYLMSAFRHSNKLVIGIKSLIMILMSYFR